MTYKEFVILKLDEIIKGIQGVRHIIQSGGAAENEDWQKAARPMNDIMNILGNYRGLRDMEVDGKLVHERTYSVADRIEEETIRINTCTERLYDDWETYIRQQGGEVTLQGSPEITMRNGSSERMTKLLYRDGEVYIADGYGHEWLMRTNAGPMTWIELYDVVFGSTSPSEE